MIKICSSCGAQIAEGSTFCTNCGATITNLMPTMAEMDAPVSNSAPTMGEMDAPVVNPAPTLSDMGAPSMNSAPIMSDMGAPSMSSAPAYTTTQTISPEAPAVNSTYSTPSYTSPTGSTSSYNYNNPIPPMPSYNVPKKNNSHAIIAILIVVIIGVVALFFVQQNNSAPFRKPIDNLAKGMQNCDWDTFIGAYPDEFAKKLNENIEAAGMDKKEFLKTYIIKELEDEYGDNIKISFIITSKTKMKSSELSSLEEKLNSKLGCNVTIKEGYEVKCKEKITGSKKSGSPSEKITVVKIDDKWSVLNDDMLDAL